MTAELAIPVNHEIHLLMHSKDVGHSFFVPELRVHQDFVPGLDLSLHFTATKIGKYEIVCTQLCGLGHYNMKAYLEVMSQQDYRRLAEEAGGTPVSALPRSRGERILLRWDPCTICQRTPGSTCGTDRLH